MYIKKIQSVRNSLVTLNLKKSGRNDYSKFNYYEMGDFLPSLNKLMDEAGLMTRFVLNTDKAVLEVFNSEKPEEKVVFYSPVAEVEIGKSASGGGAQPIQNLGGKITYMRRYLLMIAFEISETEAVDDKAQDFKNKELDEENVLKLKSATSLQELNAIANKIKNSVGAEYQKSLVAHYTTKKEELNDNPQS